MSTDATVQGGLTRVTVNLTPRAVRALESVMKRTGVGKTDTICQAVRCYDVVLDLIDQGGGRLLLEHADGTRERVTIL